MDLCSTFSLYEIDPLSDENLMILVQLSQLKYFERKFGHFKCQIRNFKIKYHWCLWNWSIAVIYLILSTAQDFTGYNFCSTAENNFNFFCRHFLLRPIFVLWSCYIDPPTLSPKGVNIFLNSFNSSHQNSNNSPFSFSFWFFHPPFQRTYTTRADIILL